LKKTARPDVEEMVDEDQEGFERDDDEQITLVGMKDLGGSPPSSLTGEHDANIPSGNPDPQSMTPSAP